MSPQKSQLLLWLDPDLASTLHAISLALNLTPSQIVSALAVAALPSPDWLTHLAIPDIGLPKKRENFRNIGCPTIQDVPVDFDLLADYL